VTVFRIKYSRLDAVGGASFRCNESDILTYVWMTQLKHRYFLSS